MSDSLFPERKVRHELGKKVSLILRGFESSVALRYDEYGFVGLEDLIAELKVYSPNLTREHIKEIVEKDPQRRFEIKGEFIRAKTGHRFPVEALSPPLAPPEHLYHGTSATAANRIMREGILKMGKAYVHLASTIERAKVIGLRKCKQPVILRVKSRAAHNKGIRFWRSGQVSPDGEIFLSEEIPAEYLERIA